MVKFIKENIIRKEDLELFPEFDDFCKDLEKLSKIDLSNNTNEEIYNIIYDYAKIIPSCFGKYNSKKFNKITFYRARLKKNISSIENENLIQTYSFPPSNVCTQNGRANLKNHSVFYCSNDPRAAILETKPELGDEIYLSVWKGISNRDIKFNLCLPTELPENNIWNIVANDKHNYLKETLPYDAKEKLKHYNKLFNYISNCYLVEKPPYSITSMISHLFLFQELINDFIVYPSVVSNSYYCNMAFHPNSALENLKFKKVYKLKINDLDNEKIQFNFGKIGGIENSRMVWKDTSKEDKKELIY